MKHKTWRDRARPIIQRVLEETAGNPEKEIREALKKAYPFGPREYYPYQVWLDEIRAQRGLKRKKIKAVEVNQNQEVMF